MIQTNFTLRVRAGQEAQSLPGVAETVALLEAGDLKPRVVHQLDGSRETIFERGELRAALERIAGRDQQPDLVERQTLQAFERDQPMALVRRVEAAAEQADPHSRFGDRQRRHRHQGRNLPGAADQILERAELLEADRTAGVELAGRDTDLAAEAELAAIGELRRGVVQQDGAVDLVEEALHRRAGLR